MHFLGENEGEQVDRRRPRRQFRRWRGPYRRGPAPRGNDEVRY